MPRRPIPLRLPMFVAALWVALATALVSAVAPGGLPRSTALGSAFNPATTTVALKPLRVAPRIAAEPVRSDDGPAAGTSDLVVAADAAFPARPVASDGVQLFIPSADVSRGSHPVLDGSPRGPPLA